MFHLESSGGNIFNMSQSSKRTDSDCGVHRIRDLCDLI